MSDQKTEDVTTKLVIKPYNCLSSLNALFFVGLKSSPLIYLDISDHQIKGEDLANLSELSLTELHMRRCVIWGPISKLPKALELLDVSHSTYATLTDLKEDWSPLTHIVEAISDSKVKKLNIAGITNDPRITKDKNLTNQTVEHLCTCSPSSSDTICYLKRVFTKLRVIECSLVDMRDDNVEYLLSSN